MMRIIVMAVVIATTAGLHLPLPQVGDIDASPVLGDRAPESVGSAALGGRTSVSPAPTPSPSGTGPILSPDPGDPLKFSVPPTTSPEEKLSVAPQAPAGIDGGVLLLSLIGGVVVVAVIIGVVRTRAKRP